MSLSLRLPTKKPIIFKMSWFARENPEVLFKKTKYGTTQKTVPSGILNT